MKYPQKLIDEYKAIPRWKWNYPYMIGVISGCILSSGVFILVLQILAA